MHNKSVICDHCKSESIVTIGKREHVPQITEDNNGMIAVTLPLSGGRPVESCSPDNLETGIFDFCDMQCLSNFLTTHLADKSTPAN